MTKQVVKMSTLQAADVTINAPEKVTSNTRFSTVECPMIQTDELTFNHDNGTIEILCSAEHADKIHQIDDTVCTILSDKSESWFGQKITYDQIERMFRPTLQGNKNPRHILSAETFKAFDSDTNVIDSFPLAGTGVFIIKLQGVNFEEKVCEAKWSIVQAKECPSPPEPSSTPPPPLPLFV
jgi:hypothetical protein